MIQSIYDIYNKHTVLIRTFSPESFYLNNFSNAIAQAKREGIKVINMVLFVPERISFTFGIILGKQYPADQLLDRPSVYKTVSTGLLCKLDKVSVYTDIFSEDKLIEKENMELRGF